MSVQSASLPVAQPPATEVLLQVQALRAGYGAIQVLHGCDFQVRAGEACVILGANGAGKTTTLRALSGMIPRQGRLQYAGRDISAMRADAIARLGIGHVPQGRGTFRDLSVRENLALGAVLRRDHAAVRRDEAQMLEVFPRLQERLSQQAGHLSGGEQQMLAVARALMADPRLLLLDEPSLGLAPKVVRELFEALAALRRERALTLLIVEQNAALSLALADQGYVLENGRFVASGTPTQLTADTAIRRAYLGV